MGLIGEKIQAHFRDDLFLRNRIAARKRFNTIARTILIGAIICYVFLFFASFRMGGFAVMRRLYVAVLAIFSVLLVVSFRLKEKAAFGVFYISFFTFIGLCTYSSSFIFPDSISVMVLLALFIFPALFLDKGCRVNAVALLTAVFYLAVIRLYKTPACFAEELINVICFTLLGCIVGSYTRKAQFQNFDTMEQLRISREQYQIAVKHSNGILCEYNIPAKCVIMKPEGASIHDAAQTIYGVPYEQVKQGMVSKETSDAYIKFYESILHGEKTGTAEFLSKTDDGWRWQKAVFTTIFSDAGKPLSAVISFMDVTERRAQEEAQRKKAELDGLTGIYNRATTESLVNLALLEQSAGVFLLIDLDNLKTLNDTYGHPQGDVALRTVAQTLLKQFRQIDIVGRVGGDEFVAFMRGEDAPERISRIMDVLMAQLAKCRVGEPCEQPLSVSIGVAVRGKGDSSFDALYKKADIALYTAKENGKKQYAFYSQKKKTAVDE